MKTTREYGDTAKHEVSIDVNVLLKAINKICESRIRRSQDGPEHVSAGGHDYHT